jgi:hypothetical protein
LSAELANLRCLRANHDLFYTWGVFTEIESMADSIIQRFLRKFARSAPPQVSTPAPAPPVAELEDYLSTAGTMTDRRSSVRRWGDPVQVAIAEVDSEKEPQRGWVMNRSTGGLGLSVSYPFPNRSLLEVRAVSAAETIPWVQVQVMNRNELSGRWMLSCRYVGTPAPEAVALFK